MKKRVIVQVPMSYELKTAAQAVSEELGFSSLQEAIRILVTKFSKKEVKLEVRHAEEQLSPKAIRRYNRIAKEIEAGKNVYHADNFEDFLQQLRRA